MKDAIEYWDKFHKEQTEQKVSQFLKTMMPRLQKGKVLDIAMGSGENTVYLAENGCKVKGFDISPEAIKKANDLASSKGVEIEAGKADLDLYLMGVMEYDSIIMTYFKPSVTRYYSDMISALKQGGTLLIESYGVAETPDSYGKGEEYKDYYFKSNEVIRNLKGLTILFYQEGLVNGKHVVQCLARKPIDKHSAKHDLFDMNTNHKDVESSKHLDIAEQLFKK